MGYHKDNIGMMKHPKQLQGINPSYELYLASICCWINWHMPPQILNHHHPQLPTL